MQKFIDDLATPYWWLSIVLVSLLLNVAANYITRFIDIARGRARERRTQSRRLLIESMRRRADELVAHRELIPLAVFQAQRERWRVVSYGLCAALASFGTAGVSDAWTLVPTALLILGSLGMALAYANKLRVQYAILGWVEDAICSKATN